MHLIEIVSPELSFCDLEATSKKNLIEQVSKLISQEIPSISADELFDGLIARERLGSTGVGDGVAIPHCRVAHLQKPIGAIVSLKDAIDFDSIDRLPVNLAFVLLVPKESTDEHLKLLGQIATLFNQVSIRQSLKHAVNNESLFQSVKNILTS